MAKPRHNTMKAKQRFDLFKAVEKAAKDGLEFSNWAAAERYFSREVGTKTTRNNIATAQRTLEVSLKISTAEKHTSNSLGVQVRELRERVSQLEAQLEELLSIATAPAVHYKDGNGRASHVAELGRTDRNGRIAS